MKAWSVLREELYIKTIYATKTYQACSASSKAASDEEESLGEKTILKLSKPYEGYGYYLYFDQFFSSVPLMQKLLSRNLYIQSYSKHTLFDKYIKINLGQSHYAMTEVYQL